MMDHTAMKTPQFDAYAQARLDVCNFVEAMTGSAGKTIDFKHIHSSEVMCFVLLEVGLDLAKDLAPELRGLLRTHISAVADEVAFVTGALHPADLAPKQSEDDR